MNKTNISKFERILIFVICRNLNDEGYCTSDDTTLSFGIPIELRNNENIRLALINLQEKNLIHVLYDTEKIIRRIYVDSKCGSLLFGTEIKDYAIDDLDNHLRSNFQEEDTLMVKEILEMIENFQRINT